MSEVAPGSVGGSDPGAWTSSPVIDELAAAYVTALGELSEIPKDRVAAMGTYSYRFADLGTVLGEVRPVLAKHGLALFQVAAVNGPDVVVTSTVMHTSGQWLEFAPLRLPAGQTAQQTGSAITYARRYSTLAVLGLATDDDDGQAAGTRTPATLSEENQQRFIQAVTDAGAVVADVVYAATQGRTDDPAEVYVTEVQALRDALKAAGEGTGSDSLTVPSPVPEDAQ